MIKSTEEKLLSLLPTKEQKKIMRLKSQVSPAEICEAENGLATWEKQIVDTDKTLSLTSNQQQKVLAPSSSKKIPPVRGMPSTTVDKSTPSSTVNNSDIKDIKTTKYNATISNHEDYDKEAIRLRLAGIHLYFFIQ